MKQLSVKRKIMLLILILLLGIKVMSCDGGLDIGSMLGCESSEGFRTLDWGEYPPDDKMYNLGMARVTRSGFDYISQNGIPLIEAAMGGSLTVPLDEVDLFICKVCNGGCELPINISSIMVEPVWPDKLHATITLPATTINNPWISLPSGCCILGGGITLDTKGSPLSIGVDIEISTDNDTGYLKMDLIMPTDTELNAIINQLNIGICGGLSGVIDLIKDAFKNLIKNMLRDLIEQQIEALTCVGCADGKACPVHPDGYAISCVEDICRLGESANDACMPMPLGLEAEIDLGSLIADFVPDVESKIWASLVAGGETEIIEQGLNIGIFGGTMVPPDVPESCAGFEQYPPVANGLTQLDFLSPGNINEHMEPAAEYHLGIGLREELLDQAGYTVNNSGLLCMALDQNTPEIGTYVGPGIFGLILPDINIYTGGGNIAWKLGLEPGPPIDFEILDGATAYPETPDLVDLALKVKIRDLSLHFYGLVEGRLVRMFTLMIDADVLAGLDAQGNKIEIQFDSNSISVENYRITYSIDGTPPDVGAQKFADLIGGIVDNLLGDLLGGFDPIEIPCFDINSDDVEDLCIDIQTIAPEDKKNGIDEYEGLYVYAALATAGSKKSGFRAETHADLVDSFMPTRDQYVIDHLKPSLILELSGRDADGGDRYLEYSYSTDNGKKWTPFRTDREIIIDSNILLLEGEHNILVRSRDMRDKSSIDLTPEAFVFTTDFTEPTLRMMRVKDGIRFVGKDNLSVASDLLYRVKVNDESWTDWSENNMLDLKTVRDFPAEVTVQVQDESGLITEKTKVYKGVKAETFSVREPRAIETSGHASINDSIFNSELVEGGCSSSNSNNGWLLLLLMLPLAFIRRMKTARAMMLPFALLLTFVLFACSGSSGIPCVTTADCPDDLICQNGFCEENPDGDDTDGDFDMPAGDKDEDKVDGDMDVEDKEDVETDGDTLPDTFPCDENGECPTCWRCKASSKMCVLQYCDPECEDPRVPVCEDTDTCSYCDTEKSVFECKMDYCDVNDPHSCDCRECTGGAMPVCKVGGVCACDEPCQCGEGQTCCTNDNPFGDCLDCPGWCEGVECEPGFAPGGCAEDNVTVCSWWEGENPLWSLCSNYDDTTCEFSGVGMPDHAPSCTCAEKPPLPIARYGSYSDMAVFEYGNKDELWISAYNRTYGDLMVGRVEARSIGIEDVYWDFIDGVPDVPPNAGPSGPRGGVAEAGDDMGQYTSIALTSEGWPMIAYQDVENGDLVLMYTKGEAAVIDDPVDGDADEDIELSEDSEDIEGEATEEDVATKFRVDGDEEDAETGDDPAYDEYGKYRWYKVVVDQTGDTGYYTDIWLDDNNRPVIVYMMKSNDEGNASALKMAIASTNEPVAAEDFSIVTIESAAIGTPYCATGDCPEVIDTPFGVGINPSITYNAGNGALGVVYYHNTTYQLTSVTDADGNVIQANDNVKYGDLKVASLDEVPQAGVTTSGSFEILTLAGNSGSLVNGDVGEFHSMFMYPTNGWLAVAFYNKTLNQLQMIFNFGSGQKLFTVDDGWRKDANDNSYQVKVGADCAIGADSVGNVYIVYQDMTNNKLMKFSGSFATGSAPGDPADPVEIYGMSSALDGNGNVLEHGLAYGYYPSMIMMGGEVPIISSYAFDMNVKGKSMELLLKNLLTGK